MKTNLFLCGGIALITCCLLIGLGGDRDSSLWFSFDRTPRKPSDDELTHLHNKFVAAFEKAMGNGFGRMTYEESRHQYKHFGPKLFSAYMGNSKWNVDQFLLVGNIYHEGKSVVYSNPNFTESLQERIRDSLSKTPAQAAELVQEPDAFEAQALHQLEDGKEIVVSSGNEKLRMVGAIRAQDSCLSCHASRETVNHDKNGVATTVVQNIKAGDLLGAFTYQLTRPSESAPPEKK